MLTLNFWIEEIIRLVQEGKSIRQAIGIVKNWKDSSENDYFAKESEV
jgi:hypothetical protein